MQEVYYAPEKHKEELLDRLRNYEPDIERHSFFVWPFKKGTDSDLWWDLPYWVKQGKLFWLESDNPGLPLKKGTVEEFPYGNISGRRWPYIVEVPPVEYSGYKNKKKGGGTKIKKTKHSKKS
ncbi:MAG: hypothetical protein AB7S75_13510 [Desulfococcaceae bacterium]